MANTAPTYVDFVEMFPEFLSTSKGRVEMQLAESTDLLSRSAWGDFYSNAIMLDAAHNLLLGQLASQDSGNGALQVAAGTISSVSVAGINTSFNSSASAQSKNASESFYSKTFYGQKFLRLRGATVPLVTASV